MRPLARPFVPLLVVLLLLGAGCSAPKAPIETRSASGAPLSPTPNLPSLLSFKRCDEINLVLQGPAEKVNVPAMFTPKRSDAAGATASLILTFMRCEALNSTLGNVSEPMGFFLLVPVEPLAKAPIAGASSHHYLAAVSSAQPGLVDGFRGMVQDPGNDTIEIAFADQPMAPKSQGAAAVKRGTKTLFTLGTATVGPPRDGAKGQLGVYMHRDLELTRTLVVFSAYRYYANGQATFERGDGTPGAGVYDGFAVAGAGHNLAYDVEFRLNRTPVKWH